MSEIIMESAPYEVTGVRKTQARFWKDVKVGDVLRFRQEVRRQSGHSRGPHAVDIKITNETSGKMAFNSMTQASNNMRGFGLEEVSE